MQISDEMVEKACLAYWGEKNMTSMFGRKTLEGVMQSMRNALEAALSTDAEPVKTAPAVAVKALRPFAEKADRYDEIPGLIRFNDDVELWQDAKNRGMEIDITVGDLRRAREAYSALYAQVQDMAGWQSMDSAPTDGSEFVAGRRYAPDGEFVVHTYKWVGEPNYWSSKRNGVCIRPQYQDDFVWCPLPASPASKHGDAE